MQIVGRLFIRKTYYLLLPPQDVDLSKIGKYDALHKD